MSAGGFTRMRLAIAREAVKSIRGGAVSIRHAGFPVDPHLFERARKVALDWNVVSC
jgi:hypothetical protein